MKKLQKLIIILAVAGVATVLGTPSRPAPTKTIAPVSNLSQNSQEASCGGCWGDDPSCASCHMMCTIAPLEQPYGECVNCADMSQLCSSMPWGQLTAKTGKLLKMRVGYAKKKMPVDHTVRAIAVHVKELRCKVQAPMYQQSSR